MNAEQRHALRDAVARLVMGWDSAEMKWAYSATATLWHGPDGEPRMTVQSWRPDEDDAQCMGVADRMVELGYEYVLGSGTGGAYAKFIRGGREPPPTVHRERRIALLEAALAALRR